MGKATEDTSVQLGGWVEGFGSERVNMKLTAPSPIDKVGENTVQLHSLHYRIYEVLVPLSERLGASARLCKKNSGSMARRDSGLFEKRQSREEQAGSREPHIHPHSAGGEQRDGREERDREKAVPVDQPGGDRNSEPE